MLSFECGCCELEIIWEIPVEHTCSNVQSAQVERSTHQLRDEERNAPMNIVLIIPTGVGCEIGGHAGDANPVAKLMGGVLRQRDPASERGELIRCE